MGRIKIVFLLMLMGYLSPLCANQYYWSQGSEAKRDGATYIYADRSAKLPWQQRFGDYIDSKGQYYGDVPFSTTRIQDIDKSRQIRVDISDLVHFWLAGKDRNHGVYLQGVGKKGITKFISSENMQLDARPRLQVTTKTASYSIEVILDTSLNGSTVKSLGASSQFTIERGHPSLIALASEVNDIDPSQLVSAELLLTTTKRQFGHNVIGVFAIAPLKTSPVERGIAQQHPNDVNLDEHPSVVFVENFEPPKTSGFNLGGLFSGGNDREWVKKLVNVQSKGTYGLVNEDHDEGGFSPWQGHALQMEFTPKASIAFGGNYPLKQLMGYEPEQMYFRYYVRLGENWSPRIGGKFPGFAGTYGKAGWGGRKVDGYNGWSARGAYNVPASANSYFNGLTPLGNYVYKPSKKQTYGLESNWHGAEARLQRNRWYSIEQFVKLNDVGESNGELHAWVDGHRVLKQQNMLFRKTEALKIESVWINFYHGGTIKPNSHYRVFMDNLVISHQYIGPMKRN